MNALSRIPVTARFVIAGAVLACLPLLKLPAFYESFLYLVAHWIVLATSWNILSGYSGYFSFGHGAFFGVGMYTTAVLSGKLDWPFLWTLPVAAVVSALSGMALRSTLCARSRADPLPASTPRFCIAWLARSRLASRLISECKVCSLSAVTYACCP